MCRATPWGGLGQGKPWPYKTPRQVWLRLRRAALQPATSNPRGFEGSVDALEILVTCDQGCLPGLGEGGGEAVGSSETDPPPLVQDTSDSERFGFRTSVQMSASRQTSRCQLRDAWPSLTMRARIFGRDLGGLSLGL